MNEEGLPFSADSPQFCVDFFAYSFDPNSFSDFSQFF
jgi:hypothetical protein